MVSTFTGKIVKVSGKNLVINVTDRYAKRKEVVTLPTKSPKEIDDAVEFMKDIVTITVSMGKIIRVEKWHE